VEALEAEQRRVQRNNIGQMRSTIAQNVERGQLLDHAERVLAAFVGGINKEVGSKKLRMHL
jgi:hypothetical protein